MEIRPTGIKADRNERIITISWNDDTVSTYTFDGLRLACPCVDCKGGHAHMGRVTPRSEMDATPETDLSLNGIESVGAYAIRPLWSDGHDTGIYSFTLLKALS